VAVAPAGPYASLHMANTAVSMNRLALSPTAARWSDGGAGI